MFLRELILLIDNSWTSRSNCHVIARSPPQAAGFSVRQADRDRNCGLRQPFVYTLMAFERRSPTGSTHERIPPSLGRSRPVELSRGRGRPSVFRRPLRRSSPKTMSGSGCPPGVYGANRKFQLRLRQSPVRNSATSYLLIAGDRSTSQWCDYDTHQRSREITLRAIHIGVFKTA